MSMIYQTTDKCKGCSHHPLVSVFEFGEMPLADVLLSKNELNSDVPKVPLTLCFCENCSLLQIAEHVLPGVLFPDSYPYYTSVSKGALEHFENSAKSIIEKYRLDEKLYVMEAASNDGYMLRHFREAGIPHIGIEPAGGPARAATVSYTHLRAHET